MRLLLLLTLSIISKLVFSQPTLTPMDLKDAPGNWVGTLTYLDYRKNTPVSIRTRLKVVSLNNNEWILDTEYPDEPKANNKDTVALSNAGTSYNDATIIKHITTIDGIQFITEKRGTDGNDNKPCTFNYIYTITETHMTIRKDVLFDGTSKWITRNEYRYARTR